MPLKNWFLIHARWSKSSLKHSIRFCGIFSNLKNNFIAYPSSKVSDCIFDIHHLWQSDISRVYSNSCYCSFKPKVMKIGQPSHKMYSNNILNFQESTAMLNAHTKTSGNLSYAPRIYSYKYIYIWGSLNKFSAFFRMGTSTHIKTVVPFVVISFGYSALVVPSQQLLDGPMEVLLCEHVNDLRHRLFHLLNCLITTASELREKAKVTGSKVWTIGWVRNCLEAHLGQIVCDKDGVVDWCIVLVEMPLTWFKECWPLLMESLSELP